MITDILEIFSSIQGEGPYVGERQIFIRLKDCNLDCIYCDVDKTRRPLKVTVEDIVAEIKKINKKIKHKTISLTGGEPLLYTGFLQILLPELKKMKFKIYLETNATLPDELKKIISYIDIVSADIKLPSVTGERPFWESHKNFIKIASDKNIFIKIIVSRALKIEEFKKAVLLVKRINNKLPFIIQPVMIRKKININSRKLFKLQGFALKFLEKVLIIPQMHKVLGVR